MSNKSRKVVWESPPRPPNPDMLVNDTFCQGIVGVTLHRALQALQQEQNVTSNQQTDQKKKRTRTEIDGDHSSEHERDSRQEHNVKRNKSIFLQSVTSEQIMRTFAEAVARSHQQISDRFDETGSLRTAPSKDTPVSPVNSAPCAILRGKVDHYNRRSSRWRFLVKDIELVERKMLDPNRRLREKPPFWKTVCEQSRNGFENGMQHSRKTDIYIGWKMSCPLEILTYNDS